MKKFSTYSSQELANVTTKLTEVNEELMQHLREKGEVSDDRLFR